MPSPRDAIAPLRPSRLAQAGDHLPRRPDHDLDGRDRRRPACPTALPRETRRRHENWAEFLTGLTHGPEISLLTAYIVTFHEAQQICGSNALGCYGHDELVAPGELALADATPEEVVRHEYGHHIAGVRPAEHAVGGDRWGAQAVGERDGRLCTRGSPRGLPR